MTVHVDEPRQHDAAARIDDSRAARNLHACARPRRKNPIAADDHNRVVDRRRAGAVDETRAVDRDRLPLSVRVGYRERDGDERSRRPQADGSARAPRSHRDAVVGVTGAFSHVGSTNPPLPAESHTGNRTHDLPLASNGMAKCFVPNGPRSVAEMI